MKHLLTGVAMAAALAIAAPVWAQNAPMTPTTPSAGAKAPSGGTSATPMASKPMASKPMAKKPMHRVAHRGMSKGGGMNSSDSMTDQLNQQELQRIQGGNMSAPPPGAMNTGGGMPPSGGMQGGGMQGGGMQGGGMQGGGMQGGGMQGGGMGAPPPAR